MGQKNSKGKPNGLTDREIEIIKLTIEEELSNAKIAEKLGLTVRTIETHRKNIYRKTSTKNIIALVKYAHQYNIVELIWSS